MVKKRSVKVKKVIRKPVKRSVIKKVSLPAKKKGFLGLFGRFTPLVLAGLSLLLSIFFLNPSFTGNAISTNGAGTVNILGLFYSVLGLFYFVLGLFCALYYFAINVNRQ